jgi:DNA-binding transcriptional MocR family regulator
MPIANRLKLLEYIKKVDGLVIEDDYDSELSYKKTRKFEAIRLGFGGFSEKEIEKAMEAFSKTWHKSCIKNI